MNKNFLSLILSLLTFLCTAGPERLAEMKARSAEMRLNRMLLEHPEGVAPEVLETAEMEISGIARDLKLGREWKETPPVFFLPHLPETPKMDGRAEEIVWVQALEWRGSYLCSNTEKRKDGSIWRLAWNENRIFGSVVFPGKNPVFYKGRAGEPRSVKRIWQGDCLEVFLQPEPENQYYAEFLFRPGDIPWSLDHILCGNGRRQTIHFHLNADAEVVGRVTPDGYELEFSIDPRALRKDWRKYGLRNGDRFRMTMVRMKSFPGGGTEQSSFYPLLYSGHNIFCYAEIVLEKTAPLKKH